MANSHSFADVIGRQNNGQPIVITSSTTLHQAFQIGTSAAVLNVPTSFLASIDVPIQFLPSNAQGQPFIVRAAGTVTGGEKYQVDIVASSTALTPVVASTGLSNNGLTNDNWYIQAVMMWDSASGFLRGIQSGWAGPNAVTGGTLTQVVSGLTLATLQFSVVLTIASANANASFALTEFSADYL